MATLHGRGGKVAIRPGTGGTAALIAEAKRWSIETDRQLDDDSAFGDTWRTQQPGMLSWSFEIECNFDNAEADLWTAAIALSTTGLYLYPDAGTATRYYSGECWPKVSIEVGIDGVAIMRLSGDGDGAPAIN